MTPITKKLVLAALEEFRNDNLPLARSRFKGMTKRQMKVQYKGTQWTRQEYLDLLEARQAEIDAAIEEVERF